MEGQNNQLSVQTNLGRRMPASSQKGRSTVARSVLATIVRIPDDTFDKMLQYFPDLTQEVSAEEFMTLSLLIKAIKSGDHQAYNALLDSAYGKPKDSEKTTKEENVSTLKLPMHIMSYLKKAETEEAIVIPPTPIQNEDESRTGT